jgi:hypothetical protein
MLGAIVEVFGLAVVAIGVALGVVAVEFALLLAAVAVGYGLLLSLLAITVEEFSYRRYRSWRDLGLALLASVVENLGYRQLHAWWRVQGIVAAMRDRPSPWEVVPRTGFGTPDGEPVAVRR